MPRSQQPAVPVRLLGLRRVGGLPVPWISFEHGGHAAFGTIDPRKRLKALAEMLCQVCGQPLEERICLVVRPLDVRELCAPEPGLHPECVVYAKAQCPMLNGTSTHYRRRAAIETHPAGQPCDDPTCPCPVSLPGPDHEVRSGRIADDFDSWMIDRHAYALKWSQGDPPVLLGVDLDVPVLRKRPVRRAPLTAEQQELLDQLRALFGS